MKSIYLAGKINSDENVMHALSSALEERGHKVLEKWWETDEIPRPYLEYPETSSVAAESMLDAAYESDVCILFPGNKILGAAVELGAAIASKKENPDKQIIIVDLGESRQSIFYAHPAVVVVSELEELRSFDWY